MIKTLTSLSSLVALGCKRRKDETIQIASSRKSVRREPCHPWPGRADAIRRLTDRLRAAAERKRQKQLGSVRNEVASTLLLARHTVRQYREHRLWLGDWCNFTSSYDSAEFLQSIMSDPPMFYDILTSPQNLTRYQNRYAILIKAALEVRDGRSINLIDVAKTGHTSPYGQFEIDDLDAIIAKQFGGESAAIHSSSMSSAHRISFAGLDVV